MARKYAPDDWEKRLMKLGKLTRTIHIACEDLDFIWSTDDLAEFRDMWRRGFSIEEIREYFDRESWHEVIIIALDQIRWGYIKPRSNMLQVEGVKA
ncbi:hypothetical protein [Paenibacillus polymyxa]|uniref:hypothetical protein n=1 Tax=Paenibacillus polymyxa TaxID=1406 RepID=UPI001249A078|nr:hypothetical protein [Paenibacillus polymyxa]